MDLVIQGEDAKNRLHRHIHPGETVRLGRAPRHGLVVHWDMAMSREHANLTVAGETLEVKCLETARNPIVYRGNRVREVTIAPGDKFKIGGTTFALEGTVAAEAKEVDWERLFQPGELTNFTFANAPQRLELLSRIPKLVAVARTDADIAQCLVKMLIQAIPHADVAAALWFEPHADFETEMPSMRWASHADYNSPFRPSRRLMRAAMTSGNAILHCWSEQSSALYSMSDTADWAFCSPLRADTSRGWCLYVSGKFGSRPGAPQAGNPEALNEDLRFAELLSEFLGSYRHTRALEHRHVRMSQFFSPAVLETLSGSDFNLEPRECDISVIFCDVRGFARKAEAERKTLTKLLERVSRALGLMTSAIVKHDGVIADFQGDAALAFWGWPLDNSDGPLPACRAALEIQAAFIAAAAVPDGPLSDFRVGIGVAHGPAVAGRIGTLEQSKVGAFGPVVNLGSRLEALTKQLGVSSLVDEVTAGWVQHLLPRSEGRCRKLGRFRPYGLNADLDVSELLPAAGRGEIFSEEYLAAYAAALEAFEQGNWPLARGLFGKLPGRDGARDFLLKYLAEQPADAPPDWKGVVVLTSK